MLPEFQLHCLLDCYYICLLVCCMSYIHCLSCPELSCCGDLEQLLNQPCCIGRVKIYPNMRFEGGGSLKIINVNNNAAMPGEKNPPPRAICYLPQAPPPSCAPSPQQATSNPSTTCKLSRAPAHQTQTQTQHAVKKGKECNVQRHLWKPHWTMSQRANPAQR